MFCVMFHMQLHIAYNTLLTMVYSGVKQSYTNGVFNSEIASLLYDLQNVSTPMENYLTFPQLKRSWWLYILLAD